MNSATYPDGRKEHTVITGATQEALREAILADMDAKLKAGAVSVTTTRIDNKYAMCPCGSKEPFANCCGKAQR